MPLELQSFRLDSENYLKPAYYYLLSQDRIEYIDSKLQIFMDEHKPYLKFRYAIRNLAEDIGVHAYQLSAYLNRQVGLNFNDYLNQYRVRHCEELMRTGLVDKLNLKGLAFRCGFNNRNTLTTAFKKFTGLTPSEYKP